MLICTKMSIASLLAVTKRMTQNKLERIEMVFLSLYCCIKTVDFWTMWTCEKVILNNIK